MGLFDFVVEAGSKLFGGGDYEKKAAENVARTPEMAHADRAKGEVLARRVTDMGFEVEGLSVKFLDGTATVKGQVSSQADREKVILLLGNTQGVARVDDQIQVTAPEPEATFYTVRSGDTLSKIAKTQYGDAMKYPVIFEANQPMLKDPNRIYPGQVLRIPPLES